MRGWIFAMLVTATLGPTALSAAPAGATEDSCIATYDRQGNVTGRYCPDGTVKPPPAGQKRAARAPDSVDPEATVPADAKGDGSGRGANGLRAAPKGGQIQCGAWKNEKGTGCRGIFTILK
ncbi:MAG: hypothetical protein U1E62_02515 [Alsobacter sp.]